MRRRAFVLGLAASGFAGGATAGFRDPLETPSQASRLAANALLNGLARAGDRVVAVGQRGHALWSDDAGRSWRQAAVASSSDLVAVAFAGARSGWAVGHDGLVVASMDGGQSWQRQLDGRGIGERMLAAYAGSSDQALAGDAKRIAAQGADNPLLDVWFEDARRGWAVGAFGVALGTVDGGASWEPLLHAIENPKGLHLYAVRGIAGEVWIAGEQGLLLKLDRATGRFGAVELPVRGTLFGIVGHERALLAHGLRGSVVRSTDGGRRWQPVASGVAVGLTASTLDADGRIVIVSQAGHLLVGRDDGASLVPVRLERPAPAAAVVAAAPGTLVVAGPRGAHRVDAA